MNACTSGVIKCGFSWMIMVVVHYTQFLSTMFSNTRNKDSKELDVKACNRFSPLYFFLPVELLPSGIYIILCLNCM